MIYSFGEYQLDTGLYSLRQAGELVPMEPLSFDLLLFLVENRSCVVARETLLDNLWKGKVVTDSALAARLKDVRRAVGDSGKKQSVIKTLHGRGYQFVADTRESSAGSQEAIIETLIDGPDFLKLPDKPSIAVLPFTNLANDSSNDYFCEAIAGDIITALSKIQNMLVIAQQSTAAYRGQVQDLRQIAGEQGVQYILQGSVQKSENRVRVTVILVNANSGQNLWAERYVRELNDIFAVQDEVMREVVVALDVKLNSGEQARVWSSGTASFEAWECFSQAQYNAIYDMNPDTKVSARQLLEKAIELDSDYAMAWVMQGWIYQQYADVASLAKDARGTGAALQSMLDCAQKALSADPDCADACCLMAMYWLEIRDFGQALEMAEKALLLAPGNANNLSEISMIMNKTGNPARALELKKRAMRICPLYRPGYLRGLGLSYYLLEQFETAIQILRESIVRETHYLTAYTYLAAIHAELGDDELAQQMVEEILNLAPDFSVSTYICGISFRQKEVLDRFRLRLLKAGLPQ